MLDALPWLLPYDKVLVSGSSGLVLAYLGANLVAMRRASAPTRVLGVLLVSSALNMLGVALWRAAYDPGLSLLGTSVTRITRNFNPLVLTAFAYLFTGDDRPRERRVVLGVLGAALLPSLAAELWTRAYGEPVYIPWNTAWTTHVPRDAEFAARGFLIGRYAATVLALTQSWALVVLVRKCVRHELAARGIALSAGSITRALVRPTVRAARAARDFALPAIALALTSALSALGMLSSVSAWMLLVSCVAVWVYVNHSPEATRLRFKLVAIPVAIVYGLLALLLGGVAVGDRVEFERRAEAEVVRVRAAYDRARAGAQGIATRVMLEAHDVDPGVAFVLERPVSGGAYGVDLRTVYARAGVSTASLANIEREELGWLVDAWAEDGVEPDPAPGARLPAGTPTSERASLLRDALRSGLRPRWSRVGESWWFLGALRPPPEQFITRQWQEGDVVVHVGWAEIDRRRALARTAGALAVVLVAGFPLLVLGLPLLFRASVLRPIEQLLAGVRRVEAGDLTSTVDVRSMDEFGVLARAFDGMVASVRQARERLERINRAAFRFVPRAFLSRLGHESIVDVELGDQVQRTMTVLFADVRDFTSHCERMSPGEAFEFVNALLREVGPVIREHGGFIDKYLGDAVMALFDGPPDAALDAALDMQDAVARLNTERSRTSLPPVRMGIGLHTGALMLGVIGEDERIDTSVLSDAVNAASRIEGLTKQFGKAVLASGPTIDALEAPARFEIDFVAIVQVKGRASEVAIHEVRSRLGSEGRPLR